MELLLIRLPTNTASASEKRVEWQLLDSDLVPIGQSGEGSLAQASEFAQRRKVFVLAPSEDILLREAHLEARNRQQLLKAIPYALEEELAEDVESLHFAVTKSKLGDVYPVAVVSRERMSGWLGELEAAKILPQAIIPELLCLPITKSNWSILLENERVLIRSGDFKGFSIESSNFEALIKLALEEEKDNPPQQINVYRCDHCASEALSLSLPVQIEEHHDCPPALMAAGLDEKRSINLLQGSYEVGSETSRLLRPWRVAALLLSIWLCVGIASASLNYWQLSRDDQILQHHIEKVFKDTFPDVQRVVNPRVQMEQKLNALLASQQGDQGNEFMTLLGTAGQAINANTGVQLQSLNFRQNRLELKLTAPDLQSLENIKRENEKSNLNATIESAETIGQKVNARITIQRSRQ